jgi:hypothetical protein
MSFEVCHKVEVSLSSGKKKVVWIIRSDRVSKVW